jgi:hypothetical protein
LDPIERAILNHWTTDVGRSVKFLLVFASTVIRGFSLLEIHRHVRGSKWGLLFDEGGVGLSI